MSDIKWIKITTGMFDDEKIKIIEKMPDADALLVIWIKLICQAGRVNDGGYVYLADGFPYNEEDLSTVFNRPVNTIRLALKTFEKLKMIEITERGIFLINFEKNQNIEAMLRIRELTRDRVRKFREKKLIPSGTSNVNGNGDVTHSNADVTQQIRIDKNRKEYIRKEEECNVTEIWNNVLTKIKPNINEANYRTYLSSSVGIERKDGIFVIGVKSETIASYLEKNQLSLISNYLTQECGEKLRPRFVLIEVEDGNTDNPG